MAAAACKAAPTTRSPPATQRKSPAATTARQRPGVAPSSSAPATEAAANTGLKGSPSGSTPPQAATLIRKSPRQLKAAAQHGGQAKSPRPGSGKALSPKRGCQTANTCDGSAA